jgi:LmbE family N-acetylglucosaminyl deacetylase
MSADTRDLHRFDCLYVSSRAGDALASCAGRLLSELARGERVMLVSLVGGVDAQDGLEVAREGLGVPAVDARRAASASDESFVKDAAEALREIGFRTKARQVYVPLGLGDHPDHQLAHEAGLRAFKSGAARNVFLYEERPEALVPGAVRMRLARLGAWLPPGAADAAFDAGLARFLLRFHVPATARGATGTWSERLRSTRDATRDWRAARAWSPIKGRGPRLQPMVHSAESGALPAVRSLLEACSPRASVRPRLARRLDALAAAYARQLGSAGHVERYWLLLPARDRDAQATVAPPGAEDALTL